MKPCTLLVAVACVMLASSTVQASSVRYVFQGELDDGTTQFQGWFEIDSPPSNSSSDPNLGTYLAPPAPPFLDWQVDIGGSTYGPSGSFKGDELYVLDATSDPDKVLVFSSYEDVCVALLFTAEDGDAISGVDIPDLAKIDWPLIELMLTDRSGGKAETYAGTVEVFVVPLPMSLWAGFGMLCGLGLARRLRRKS